MKSATHRRALCAVIGLAALAGGTGCRTYSHSAYTGPAAVSECSPGACPDEGGADCPTGHTADLAAQDGADCRSGFAEAGCPDGSCPPGGCRNGNCPNGNCPHGKPPKRWSDEWYASEAAAPVSARQVEKYGKQWPPYPRPVGKKPQCSHIYHAAHYWPYPYVCDDRAYVRSVLALQEQNGWMEASTLYDYHFDPETQQVNQPGRLHLRWVLQNPRPEYRLVYVQTGDVAAITHARLAAAREAAIELVGEADLPPIMPRMTDPLGRPAREIEAIQRAIEANMLPPVIQYNALPSGAGTGGGT